jgi:hypothetical protein
MGRGDGRDWRSAVSLAEVKDHVGNRRWVVFVYEVGSIRNADVLRAGDLLREPAIDPLLESRRVTATK